MATKRCPFCGKKLKDGYCYNENCVDYKRTQIHEKEVQNEQEEPKENGGN